MPMCFCSFINSCCDVSGKILLCSARKSALTSSWDSKVPDTNSTMSDMKSLSVVDSHCYSVRNHTHTKSTRLDAPQPLIFNCSKFICYSPRQIKMSLRLFKSILNSSSKYTVSNHPSPNGGKLYVPHFPMSNSAF